MKAAAGMFTEGSGGDSPGKVMDGGSDELGSDTMGFLLTGVATSRVWATLREGVVRITDMLAGIMARSASSISESRLGVDLDRGSEGGVKPVESIPAAAALFTLTAGSTRVTQAC